MNIEEMASCGGGKNRGEVRIHDSLDELATDLADYVSQVSEASVRERGHFAVALSGGSLIGLMGKICQAPYTRIVDWAKWHIFWADERVVAKSHADSNYKLAKEGLISKVPVVPCHIYAINDSLPADAAARDYEFSLRQLVKTRTVDVSEICDCPKFDLILLGMGSDGHVASLFPDHPALDVKDEWVTYLIDSPKPPPERITFTLPVINSASNVAVVATGSENAEAVHLAIDDNVPTEHMSPARMVCPSDGKLVWFLEMSAASQLKAGKGVFPA